MIRPNTVTVKNIDAGPRSAQLEWLTEVEGTLFFSANDRRGGRELWRTNRSANTAWHLRDINAGQQSSMPHGFTQVGRNPLVLLFAATAGTDGLELWRTHGTYSSTVRVHDIAPGPGSSSPAEFTCVGDTIFFVADDRVHGRELWQSAAYQRNWCG